jgi:glycosyltransferase involved in cell wall biosynthesis
MSARRVCLVFPHLGLGGGETVMMDVAEGLRGEFDLDVCALQDGRQERTLVPELDARFAGWTPIRKRWELRPRFREADAVLWYGVVNGVPDVLAAMEERPASVRVVHTDREVDGPGLERRWGRRPYGVIDATVCVSPAVARKIPGAVFIPNTCSGETLKGERMEAFSDERPTLGFLGRLAPMKNVPWLIDNLDVLGCNLLIQALDTELVTAAELKRRASKAGFEKRVKFLPPSRDVGTLLRSVDALILVSDHEGFPRVVVEAGMVGTPVISTRVGALPELFGEEILFVDHPPHTRSVSVALKLLKDSREVWGRRLQEKVARLCAPEAVVARYAEVLREAINGA